MSYLNCPDDILNHIWRTFHTAGFTNDLEIIETVGLFLLAYETPISSDGATAWSALKTALEDRHSPALQGTRETLVRHFVFEQNPIYIGDPNNLPNPVALANDRCWQIIAALEDILRPKKLSAADFFNHCVIPKISGMLTGGRYPTPRHIAATMSKLALMEQRVDNIRLADFAWGSGGLLVASPITGLAVGLDISPNWIRIATANLILHKISKSSVRVGDALSTVPTEFEDARFDAIVMNPPFGLPMDRRMVWEALEWDTQARSETALTLLAYEHLKSGGNLAVLLPGGSLFSTSRTELILRETLLRRSHLNAVVELPKDAFQPYSALQTYLLLARNTPERAGDPVWFYQVGHDGYSSGRNRQPEPDKNELPRLEVAVMSQLRDPDIDVRYQDGSLICSLHLLAENQGFCFNKHIADGEIELEQLTNFDGSRASLMGSVSGKQEPSIAYILAHNDGLFASTDKAASLNFPHELMPTSSTKDKPSKRYQLTGDKLGGFAIATKRSKGTITFSLEKKGKREDIFDPCSVRSDDPYIWLLVDDEGQLIAEPITTKKAPPKEFLPESALTVPLEDEEENPLGHLVVLKERNIQVVPLTTTSQTTALPELLPFTSGYLLIWHEEGNRFARFEVLDSELKFQGDEHRRGVAIDNAGNWFGVGIDHQFIVEDRKLDLQPTTYFPAEREEEEIREPAEILAEIKTKHRRLEDHINYLLGIVELTPIAQTEIPAAVATAQPIGPLSPVQAQIWAAIQQKTEPVAGREFVTATPFRLEDVSQEADRIEVENALTLFERMGLIVPISINGAPYFRLLTSRDVAETEAAG